MTKQLEDLMDEFSQMPSEDGMEVIRRIRHNKYMARPAVVQREQKRSRKRVADATDNVSKLLERLSPEERLKLLEDLENGS